MDGYSIWKIIKTGFWFGLGFIIPLIVLFALGSMIIYKITEPTTIADFDRTSQVELLSYKENYINGQLLILGAVKNTGSSYVSSVSIEAELLNTGGDFVYECSGYIAIKIKPNEEENFQIKCGSEEKPVPQYASTNVRIVRASAY